MKMGKPRYLWLNFKLLPLAGAMRSSYFSVSALNPKFASLLWRTFSVPS